MNNQRDADSCKKGKRKEKRPSREISVKCAMSTIIFMEFVHSISVELQHFGPFVTPFKKATRENSNGLKELFWIH